jgi:pimeloyl-ACP methyl ester carboxylesterase
VTSPDRAAEAFNALVDGGVQRREIDRGGRGLRWLEAGTGEPAIVFEAGAMSPATTWASVFAELAPVYRVIAYDRAGYGASDPAPLSLDLQLGDLLAILEAAGPKPSVVVGHSWGGLLAQLAAWSRPELVAGLVLCDPSHERIWLESPDPEQLRASGEHPSPTLRPGADPRSADMLSFADESARNAARSASDDPRIRDLLIEAGLSYLANEEQLRTHLEEFPMILDNVDELAARRAVAQWPQLPMVILTATKGRPPEYTPLVLAAQDEVASVTGARHTVVPDSGHYVHIDRPDLVVDAVRDVAAASGK